MSVQKSYANHSINTPQGDNRDTTFIDLNTESRVTEKIRQEFLASGISQEVFNLNVQIVNDLEIDPITKEVTTPLADALNLPYTRFGRKAKPNLIAALLNGENGETWQAKIFGEDSPQWLNTYQNQGKRTGQYMAPKGIGDKPYLATIPNAIARKAAAKVSPLLEISLLEWLANGGLFWEWLINHPQIPLIITEGAKKALAAISQGHIALSLFGVNCGVKDLLIKPELFPYVEGRRVIIAFDRDTTQKTQHKVFKATKRLASAIAYHAKGSPFVMTWDGSQGKGLDDLIANDPKLFHAAIASAKSFEKWKQFNHTDLTDLISQKVNSRYLDKDLNAPDNVRLISIKSATGTGKTEWLTIQVDKSLKAGKRVIVIVHREQLAKELANRFDVPYRTEIKDSFEGTELGYTLCIDSLHPKANPPFNPESWEGCDVFIDECEQVLWHLLNSSTCDYNRPAIIETFKNLLNTADKIYLSDADLSKVSIKHIQNLLDEPVTPWVLVNTWKPETDRRAYVYDKPEYCFSELKQFIRNGDRIMVHTGGQKVGSKWGSFNLERSLRNDFPDLKILRIDAVTVSDPSHPACGCMGNLNAVLADYDVVIASPTIETGVSIDIDHFDRVFCFAVGSQTVEAVLQALARVRSDVPRHIWAKTYSPQRIGNGSHDPYALLKNQKNISKFNVAQLGLADAIADLDERPTNLTTWATMASLHNYGFKYYRQSIYERLKEKGYRLIGTEIPDDARLVKEEVKTTCQENYQEHCEQVAAAPIADDLAYEKLKDQRAKTEPERLSEKKTAIAKRYLTDDVTPDLVKADDDGLYGQLQLHYYLTVGNAYLQERDTKKVKKLAPDGKIFTPDLNRACLSPKVIGLQNLDLDQFFESDRIFTNESLAEWHRWLVETKADIIREIFGNSFNPASHTPIRLASKLLGKLGLKLICTDRRRIDGVITRFYQLEALNAHNRSSIFDRWLERDQSSCDTTFNNTYTESRVTPQNDVREAA